MFMQDGSFIIAAQDKLLPKNKKAARSGAALCKAIAKNPNPCLS